MNKEDLMKRLSEIEKAISEKNKSIQQCMADINVLFGCKTECEFWLKKLNGIHDINKSTIINEKSMTLDELKDAIGADSLEVVNK